DRLLFPRVPDEIVGGHLDAPPRPERVQVLDEEGVVEGVRAVEVEGGDIGVRDVRGRPVVVILRDEGEIRHHLGYLADYRGLPGSGSPADADNLDLGHRLPAYTDRQRS